MDRPQGDLPAVAALPEQRPPQQVTSADVLRSFGLDALVELVERSAYGICVTGEGHRWVYLNPAGCRIVGRSFDQVRGEGSLLRLEGEHRTGDDVSTGTVVRTDGSTLEITWSGSVLHVGDEELAPAVLHPTSVLGRPPRLPAGGSLTEVLEGLAREAVAATRGVGAVVLVEEPHDRRLLVVAHDGVPAAVADGVRAAQLGLTDLPGGELLTAGRVVLLSDDRTRLAADPATARLAALTGGPDWHGSAKVPLHRGGLVVGCLVVLLPPAVTAPSQAELVLWSALSAHASAALGDDELRRQAARSAAEQERRRLGRDLHDSVSSALFALHTRTQVVERALAAGDAALLAEAAGDVRALSSQAIAELRAVVSAMREQLPPAEDDGGQGLPAALLQLAATTRRRDGLEVRLRLGRPLPAVPTATAEHLARIAAEAVHNCVKHAGASAVTVDLDVRGSELVLEVQDEGRGFDPPAVAGDGHGQRTMRERAVLCGGWLHVDTAPRRGTRVVARVPLPG